MGRAFTVVAVLGLVAAYWAYGPRDPWVSCDRGIDEIVADAPGSNWTARGIYLGCGGPMTITAWDNVVIVKKGSAPTSGDEVLTGDWDTSLAKLEWKTDKLLQITLPIRAEIYQQRMGPDDIAVVVKFDPDDPQMRQEFLNKREQERNEMHERLAAGKRP